MGPETPGPRGSLRAGRAARAETLGSYYRYPCPIDRVGLERLQVDANTFADAALSASKDVEVLEALREVGIPSADQSRFDPIQLNARLHGTEPGS